MDFNSKYKSSEIETLLDKIKNFEGGGGKAAVVYHGTEDTTIELTPNVVHKWDSIDSLSLTLPNDEEGYVNHFKTVFTIASDAFSLALPYNLKWVNDDMPTFEVGMQYEISIEGGRVLWAKFGAELPTGELLEYIENDGVDYIMTDIYMSSRMYGMRCKAVPLFASGQTTNYAVAGTRQVSGVVDQTSFFMWYLSGQQGRMLYWNGSSKTTFGKFVNGVIYEDVWENEQNLVASDYPLIVFGGNNAGAPSYNNKFRLYSLDFLGLDGNPIVSLRPFKRQLDKTIGLIDTISGSFYPSVNGTLIGEHEYIGYEPLTYIESDGVDYILTDLYISDNIFGMICISAALFEPGGSSSKAVAGTRETSSSAAFTMWYRQAEQGRRVHWNGNTITLSAYEKGVVYRDVIENNRLTSTSKYPIAVFGMNNQGQIAYQGEFRLYGLQLVGENNEAIVNLCPYRRKDDGHIGLLDKVSGKFYTSAKGNLVGV